MNAVLNPGVPGGTRRSSGISKLSAGPEARDMELAATRSPARRTVLQLPRHHLALLAALKAHSGPALISGYPSDLYDRELTGWHRRTATATGQTSRARQEVLWLNFDPDGQGRWF